MSTSLHNAARSPDNSYCHIGLRLREGRNASGRGTGRQKQAAVMSGGDWCMRCPRVVHRLSDPLATFVLAALVMPAALACGILTSDPASSPTTPPSDSSSSETAGSRRGWRARYRYRIRAQGHTTADSHTPSYGHTLSDSDGLSNGCTRSYANSQGCAIGANDCAYSGVGRGGRDAWIESRGCARGDSGGGHVARALNRAYPVHLLGKDRAETSQGRVHAR